MGRDGWPAIGVLKMPFISLCLGLVFDGVSQQQLEGNAFEVEVACVCV